MRSFYRGVSLFVLLAVSWGLFYIVCGRLPVTTEAFLLGMISGAHNAILWHNKEEVCDF